jgi:hypothetical protein
MSTELKIHPRHNDLELGFVQTPGEAVQFALNKVVIRESTTVLANSALEQAKEIKQVTDDEELIQAIEVTAQLKQLTGGIEASRKRFKEPFLGACKLIDAAVKKVIAPLEMQQLRLQRLMGDFEGERRREQMAEKQRLEQLSRDAYRAAQTAATPEKKGMLEEVAHQTHLESREAVNKFPGAQVRLGWDAQVVDWKLLEANYPQCVERVLKKSILNDVIKTLEASGVTIEEGTIPGVKLTPTAKVIPI